MSRVLAIIQRESINWSGSRIWFQADADIDGDGGPNVYGDPCWQPETTLKDHGKSINAQTVPYIVLPIGLLNLVGPVGLGSAATVTNHRNGKSCAAVVADLGPRNKIGEISSECARRLGINPNSRNGGEDAHVISYEITPGVPAVIDGITYHLQPLGS